MAAPNLIDCMPISDFLMCKTSLPMAAIASFMAAITCADVTWSILLKRQKADIGVVLSDPSYDLMWRTMAVAIRTGHMLTAPDACWVTVSFFSYFFCISKAMDMQSENLRCGSLCSVPEKSEVAEAKDVGPSLLCLGDLEVLA